MSFMPNVGSLVRLNDGRVAIVTHFSPLGTDDRVVILGREETVAVSDIAELLHEPEPLP